jgi:hypothetical protein
MKSKLLITAFIAILLCSALSVALTTAVCPRCDGTGEIECPHCDGTGEITVEEGAPCERCSGSGTLAPTLIIRSSSHGLSDGKIAVRANYENTEDAEVHGKVTGKVEVQGHTYTGASATMTFPPNEETQVDFTIGGVSSADYAYLQDLMQNKAGFSVDKTLEVRDITCPYCDGTGLSPTTVECPYCGGTGAIDCPTCGGTGTTASENQDGALDIGGAIYGVAAVAVVAGVAIGAFVVVKKRGVKEENLKKLPPNEFQDWVLNRIGGKSSSQSDARMGIDGYTIEGQPLSIKQANDVGRDVIENFAAAMGRRNAKNGSIIAFSFGTDAIRGRVRAKLSYGREIQMVTVKELIEGGSRTLMAG